MVHVVEPTLEDHRGHCFALVRSFCAAAKHLRVTLWSGKGASKLDFGTGVSLRPVFSRRLRFFQLAALFRRLLRGPEPVVVMTARRSDLTLAHYFAPGILPPRKLFLYFHWFRETPRRVAFLRKAARAQPDVSILATTESVVRVFEQAGFRHVTHLPYPLTALPSARALPPFRHLLYAGAARRDKGFDKVVDLVALLQERKARLPVVVQTSADHYGKYDAATAQDLRRLETIGYSALRQIREPLDPEAYAELFEGAICVQAYDRSEFTDRASGVTMDALVRGCPVITTSGTWIARTIEPWSAGVVLDSLDPASLLNAIDTVRERYPSYQEGARRAGESLQARSWGPLFRALEPLPVGNGTSV